MNDLLENAYREVVVEEVYQEIVLGENGYDDGTRDKYVREAIEVLMFSED